MASFVFKTDIFKEYQCQNHVDLGIDLESLFKVLKVVTKDDLLGFEILKDNLLSVQIKNPNTGKEWCFDLKLMEIDSEELTIPPLPDGWRVVVDSDEFLNNVKTMGEFGDDVEIGCTDGKMYFRVCGEMANAMVSNNTNCTWQGDESNKENVILKFTSRLIKQYGSGKKITKEIYFTLAPDHPIMIRYNITDNSTIDMFVAPKLGDD
jgi:proliferating cell nuclear antigen PCNA